MRRRLAFFPTVILAGRLLAGCGGQAGCDTGVYYNSNPAFAGQYSALFTPEGASTPTREFRLSVLTDGTIGGLVRDPALGGEFATEVTGRVDVVSNHCDDDRSTRLVMSFNPLGTQTEVVEADRSAAGSIAATLRVRRYSVGDTATTGTLALRRVAQTVE